MRKNPPANAGNKGSILGSGRSPGGGNSNPLQYSCLGNSCWVKVNGVTKELHMTEQLRIYELNLNFNNEMNVIFCLSEFMHKDLFLLPQDKM